jgi:hypothetical protein
MPPAPPDPWELLHGRFLDTPFFALTPGVVRLGPACVVLRVSRVTRTLLLGLMLAMGVGMIGAWYLPDLPDYSAHHSKVQATAFARQHSRVTIPPCPGASSGSA